MSTYIYGAGGHGKVVFHTFASGGKLIQAFIDDKANRTLCDVPVLSPSDMRVVFPCSVHFAIGNNPIRHHLQTTWQRRGATAETALHREATIYPTATIGAGSLVAAGVVVGPDAKIGEGCIVNHNATVEHDCVIGDFCHIAPAATLCGGVTLGTQCLVGAGATILPYLVIGDFVTIGAGAVITDNLPDGVTVIGCPARQLGQND